MEAARGSDFNGACLRFHMYLKVKQILQSPPNSIYLQISDASSPINLVLFGLHLLDLVMQLTYFWGLVFAEFIKLYISCQHKQNRSAFGKMATAQFVGNVFRSNRYYPINVSGVVLYVKVMVMFRCRIPHN